MRLRLSLVSTVVILANLSFGQVVINEVMNKPATANNVNQGMIKKEYVEIYNNSCSPVDISCWILGSSAPLTGSTPYWVGAFRFPAGTVINPGQHLVIGGTQSDNGTPYPAVDIDFILGGNPNMCQAGTGGWLLPNGDGWVALFNDVGGVEDAIYWSLNTNPNIQTDLDYSTAPCLPNTSCSTSPSLPSAQQIHAANPTSITYVGLTNSFDRTFSRIPDGGAWQRDVLPSILGTNNCNGGTCNTIASFYANAQVTQPGCGTNNGTINLNPSPAGTYNYSWSPNVSSSSTAQNLGAGSYTVTITSANGCFIDTTIVLSNTGGLNEVTFSTTNASCGTPDGSITIQNVLGGSPNYSYSLDGITFTTTNQFTNLSAGNYQLFVQDANNCSLDTSFVINAPNAPTDIQSSITPADCNQNNGEISITGVTGGTPNYSYSLDNINYSSNTLYTNLSAGNYTIYVNDANGCAYSETFLVSTANGPTSASVQSENATCGFNNGAIGITNISGGSAPYQVNFNGNGFSTVTNYTNLAPGNYTISISDVNGCILNLPVENIIGLNGPSNIQLNITATTCGSDNGLIEVNNVIGGSNPFTYSLNTGASSGTGYFSNLAPGSYTLTITDQNNCAIDTNFTIAASSGPTQLVVQNVSATCDQNNGEIQIVSVINGTAPITYNLSNGTSNSTGIFSNLSPSNYTIQVVDANGCSLSETVTITGGTSPIASFNFTPNSISSLGEETVQMINESSPDSLSYQWYFEEGFPAYSSDMNPLTTYNSVSAGNYEITLIVTNNEGCSDTLSRYITVVDEILVFAPNAFTPDGDEFNNVWQPIVSFADESSFDLFIFNRWGEIVFESHDAGKGWDGTYQGKLVQDGTYTWIIQIKDKNSDFKTNYNGHLSIIR